MKLEYITVKVRPRLGWEALDLGFRMVHQHWKALYGIWFGITLPVFLLALWLFNDHLLWVLFIFWWLRPTFESALLNYLSRALFGEYPSLSSSIRSFGQYAFKQWFANHLWRRLSLTRSMDLPVSQLEGLSGVARSRRIRTLHAFNSGAARWLTVLLGFLHVLFYLNTIALIMIMMPEAYLNILLMDGFDLFLQESSSGIQSLQVILIYLVISFFSPFYIAGGFAIYINQRTILEAWDIELTFKKLASRVQDKSRQKALRRIVSSASCIVLTCSLFMISEPSSANSKSVVSKTEFLSSVQLPTRTIELRDSEGHFQNYAATNRNLPDQNSLAENFSEQSSPVQNSTDSSQQQRFIAASTTKRQLQSVTHQQARQIVEEIVTQPPFVRKRQVEEIYFEFDWDIGWEGEEESSSGFTLGRFWTGLMRILSVILEILLWCLVAALVVWVIMKALDLKPSFGFRKTLKKTTQLPQTMFGLDMEPESLPSAPGKHSWQLWLEGQQRKALSLLLRASLMRLVADFQLAFEDGYTELECSRIVRLSTPSRTADYFELLIQIWRLFAYGHKLPHDDQVKRLCHDWEKVFEARATAPSTGLQTS
jgi:hypothetical protein